MKILWLKLFVKIQEVENTNVKRNRKKQDIKDNESSNHYINFFAIKKHLGKTYQNRKTFKLF